MSDIIKKDDKWFPILTRRGAILLGWLESTGFGEKLLDFTELDLADYKEIRVVKDREYTIFLEEIIWSKTEKKFREKLKTDKTYLDRIFKKIYPRYTRLEEFSKLKDLTKFTNSKLSNQMLKYADLYSDVSPFYIVYNEVRPILREQTENWLKKKVPKDELQDCHITLTTPLKPLYAVQEDTALQEIVGLIKLDKKAKSLFRKNPNKVLRELPGVSPLIFSRIQHHLNSYYWVPVERDNPLWKMEDILNRIQYKLTRLPREVKTPEKFEKKQKRYEKQLQIPPEILINFENLRELMNAVDAMKKTYAVSHCFLSELLEVIAERLKVNREMLYFLTPNEIAKATIGQKQISKEEIQIRKNCIVIGCRVKRKWEVQIIKEEKARRIIGRITKPQIVREQKIIKGTPASPGKAIGLVKVLQDATEVDKLSQGEILVTPMTTPDYVIAIHKAAAIVTDEGGVLCHAAILSREFGIPCVIGTRIATKALKDGDRVEVDATTGEIKKIVK